MSYQDREKLMRAYTDLTVKCKCTHSMVFYNNEAKQICTWCGRTVYNKNEDGIKQQFKDRLVTEIINQKRRERKYKK